MSRQARAGGRWSRRRLLVAVVLAIGLGLAVYAFGIEPGWIEVTRHRVLAPVTRPLTIAHLSDLHTSGVGGRERALLEILEREKPDVIVLTGDSVADGDLSVLSRRRGNAVLYAGLHELLSRLHAPLGVFAVLGNWEHVHRQRDQQAFFASAGVRLLVNASAQVRDDVWLVGLDDFMKGAPDADLAARGVPAEACAIALFHSPAYFDILAGRFPVALAGHTHGGQVRIPLVPSFWLPRASGRFIAGWYDGARGSRLYVSRGVGTSTLPVRFLCRPELALVTLAPGGGR
jgi:uncharacterized protein